jgi:hypothetical protein
VAFGREYSGWGAVPVSGDRRGAVMLGLRRGGGGIAKVSGLGSSRPSEQWTLRRGRGSGRIRAAGG